MTNLEFGYIPYCKSTTEFINELKIGKLLPQNAILELKNLINLNLFDIAEVNKLEGFLKEEIEEYVIMIKDAI